MCSLFGPLGRREHRDHTWVQIKTASSRASDGGGFGSFELLNSCSAVEMPYVLGILANKEKEYIFLAPSVFSTDFFFFSTCSCQRFEQISITVFF